MPLRNRLTQAKCNVADEDWWAETQRTTYEAFSEALSRCEKVALANREFVRYELYSDWSGSHIGYVLFGLPSSGRGEKQLLDIGSSKLEDQRSSSYLGELRGLVYALKKTKPLRGTCPTAVFNDNRALVEQLQRGELVTHDVRVARLIAYLLANEENVEFAFVPGESNQGADLLSRGIETARGKPRIQLVQPIPQERPDVHGREMIIRRGHQGHWGFEKTKKNVELDYGTWPGLTEDVPSFVEKCEQCQFHAPRQYRDAPGEEIIHNFADKMYMDIAGPFRDGNYLLVLVDAATRWCKAGVINRPGVAHILPLLERWTHQFPRQPKIIAVDHGQVWQSAKFQRWILRRRIELRPTPSYYPQGIGLAERVIGTLLNRLRRTVDEAVEEWPEKLQEVVDAYNTSWHRGIDSTPITLAYGLSRNRQRLPWNTVRSEREHAIDVQRQAKDYMKALYNRKHHRLSRPLQVGDEVLVYDPTARANQGKLARSWYGPLRILAHHSRSTWIVANPAEAGGQFLAHSSQLRKYYAHEGGWAHVETDAAVTADPTDDLEWLAADKALEPSLI